jgi:hypothetical protein
MLPMGLAQCGQFGIVVSLFYVEMTALLKIRPSPDTYHLSLEAAHVCSARAGRHPSAGMLWRHIVAHDEGFDVRLVDFPINAVMDDQQGVAHWLAEVIGHRSHEIVVDRLQVDDDRLLLDAARNEILGQLFENFRAFEHELRAVNGLLGLAEEIEDDLVRDHEGNLPAVVGERLECRALAAASNFSNLYRHKGCLL